MKNGGIVDRRRNLKAAEESARNFNRLVERGHLPGNFGYTVDIRGGSRPFVVVRVKAA